MKRKRIPGITTGRQYAHDESLQSQIQDPQGKVYTYWEVDPQGNRAERRAYARYLKKMA